MNKVLSTLILIDNHEEKELLYELLKGEKRAIVIAKKSSSEGLEKLFSFDNPQIIFLNASFHDKARDKLNSLVERIDPHPKIVYTLSDDLNEHEMKEINPEYVLRKPFVYDDIADVIKKIGEEFDQKLKESYEKLKSKMNEFGKIKLKSRKGFVFISPEEIVYIKSLGYLCELINTNNEKIIISLRLCEVYKGLRHLNFYQVGRSVIINLIFLHDISKKNKYCTVINQENKYDFNISISVFRYFEKFVSVKL